MIYFDDLMCGSDLRGRASGLARPARKAHGFPALHQLGIVVPDVEEAAARLETLGFGPFFIARGAPSLA